MLLIDVPMPTNCADCFACYDYICCTILEQKDNKDCKMDPFTFDEKRRDDCPLFEQ